MKARPRPISSSSSMSSSVTGGRVGAAVLIADGRRFAKGLLMLDPVGMIVEASDCADVVECAEIAVEGLPSLKER